VYFSWKEWRLLDEAQRRLYHHVMLENFTLISSLVDCWSRKSRHSSEHLTTALGCVPRQLSQRKSAGPREVMGHWATSGLPLARKDWEPGGRGLSQKRRGVPPVWGLAQKIKSQSRPPSSPEGGSLPEGRGSLGQVCGNLWRPYPPTHTHICGIRVSFRGHTRKGPAGGPGAWWEGRAETEESLGSYWKNPLR